MRKICQPLLTISLFKNIQSRITYLAEERKQPLVLFLDEAEYLNSSILKDLKMLMNFGFDSENRFTLILSGEPYLNQTLSKPIHEALRQRITVHYDFKGLDPDEPCAYVRHKICRAGGSEDIIREDALSAITGYCRGIPREIDSLMSQALIIGEQMQQSVINADVILEAANSMGFEQGA